jgi:hypothetical protein
MFMQCNLFHVAWRRPGLLSLLLLAGSVGISLPLAAQTATPPAAVAGGATAAVTEADVRGIEETPYVQTATQVLDAMLEMAQVRGSDFLIDLGSGDGRMPITAAKRWGTRGFGVEHDPRLVQLANDNARRAGVADKVSFRAEDLFKTELGEATVVTLYLLPDNNLALRPRLLSQLRPGARIVSHDYDLGDWHPDAQRVIPVPDKPVGVEKSSKVFLWIVPARVAGKWRFAMTRGDGKAVDVELELMQNFQVFGGMARIEGRSLQLERTQLRGGYVSFRFTDGQTVHRFQGQVGNGRISGQHASGERNARWRALKVEAVKP